MLGLECAENSTPGIIVKSEYGLFKIASLLPLKLLWSVIAIDGGSSPFTKEEYDAMYDLLDELEKESKPKRSSKRSADDWKGCQGNCDFEPQPNLTGWI